MLSRFKTILAPLLAGCAIAGAEPYDVAMLEISGDPPARENPFAMFGETARTLRWYIDTIETAAADDALDAIVVRLKDAQLSTSEVEEIGRAIGVARDGGKRVHVFAEGYGMADLLLAAHADEVILQQGGGVMIPGLYMEEMFLADTLEWAGLEADFVQIGDYKGASEMLARSSPSEAWDENISGLLDAMWHDIRETLKEGRGLSDAELDRALEKVWMADGETAIEVGLVDAEVDLTDLLDHVEGRALDAGWGGEGVVYRGELGDDRTRTADFSNPFMVFSQMFQPVRRSTTGPTIALLHIDGAIVDGDSAPEGPLSAATVGSRTIRNAIKDISNDDNIEGVVVRIDSPGGSAIASEVIWQGLRRLSDQKPVWVSVGSMAASGGYYIAVGGEKIYVTPQSIVGSIGVVGGKVSMGDLLDRVHVNVVGRARGPHAEMFATTEGWDESQKRLIRDKMTETYDLFTKRVRQGRPGIDLSKTAEGRLFLGGEAIRLKMADEVGTMDDAVEDLAASLALTDYELMEYPEPPSFEEMLGQAFGGFVEAPAVDAAIRERLSLLRGVLGEEKFEALRQAWATGRQLRTEPVLLTIPRILSFE